MFVTAALDADHNLDLRLRMIAGLIEATWITVLVLAVRG